ncbi:MAG: HD-GYP domain-containing protein [Spirochaetales bacterium]|nr:HD-GYP domain-containing protein [Spirochaetales bacterium]
MKQIKVEDLVAGQKFDKPVYVDGDTLLVPENVVIREKDIERLKSWNIPYVETDGKTVTAKDEKKREEKAISGILGGNADQGAQKLYVQSVQKLSAVFDDIRQGRKVENNAIDEIVTKLVNAVRTKSEDIISLILQNHEEGDPMARSAVNCLILSVVVAQYLNFPNHHILNIALAALLHDIGMMRISENIVEKNGELSSEEIQQIQTHTLYTYRIITRELKYSDEIGKIALLHHERWDGKGYPKKLKEKQIPVMSRIISVVDAFEAMVRDRPYRNSMIGYTAMRQLLNDNSRRFDAEVLKIFIKAMGIYPVGSIVILNDGSIGRVEKIHSDAPLRPIIRLVVNARGKKLENDQAKTLDLLTEKEFFITRAVNPRDFGG